MDARQLNLIPERPKMVAEKNFTWADVHQAFKILNYLFFLAPKVRPMYEEIGTQNHYTFGLRYIVQMIQISNKTKTTD